MKTKKRKIDFRPTKKALALTSMRSSTDVNGSYTGNPERIGETPVQDADDL